MPCSLLERPGHLGGTKAAIALAQDIFWRVAAPGLGEIERNRLGKRLRIAAHAVEGFAAIGLGGPAPAGAHGVDHHEVGESEPAVRIVDESRCRGIVAGKLGDARPYQPHGEIGRRRPRAAVEAEGDGAAGRVHASCTIRSVVDRGRTLPRLVEQGQRAGGCRVSKLPAGDIERMLGNGIGGQKMQNAFARLALAALGLRLLGLLRRLAGGSLLRARGNTCEQQHQQKVAQEKACLRKASAGLQTRPSKLRRRRAGRGGMGQVHCGRPGMLCSAGAPGPGAP